MKVARIASVPFFLQNHLRGQICAMVSDGIDVTLVSSGGEDVALLREIKGIRFHQIEIKRKISLFNDVVALWQLFLFFRRERFDIVHSTTPKAGMLTAVAAFFANIPVRLHTFTGQPWMELRGLHRMIAKAGDKVTAFLNTQCYADSWSQHEFLIAQKVADSRQIQVLNSGSLAGVDLKRFDPELWERHQDSIFRNLGISPCAKVITFIGRLTRDKGIVELVTAFLSLQHIFDDITLLLVGPKDADWDMLPLAVRHAIEQNPNIYCTGYSNEPERYLAITDIFCLPSYREGFGNVVIEAAAMSVATVGTDIVGLRDAIVHQETGLLVAPKNDFQLTQAIKTLLMDEPQRIAMGKKARWRAMTCFDAKNVNAAVIQEYHRFSPDANAM